MTDVYGTHESVVVELSRDDLTKIKGIGTTTAEKLYNAKIITVKQITEMSPERLSETPGIGLATATKFIAAAKDRLENLQEKKVVSETVPLNEAVIVESPPTSIEKYEVEEVIVEEIEDVNEEPREEVEEDFDSSKPDLKWFSNKHNYSRLTASYPPITERTKESSDFIKEEEHVIIEPETNEVEKDIEFTSQPEIEQEQEYEEDLTRQTISEINIKQDQPELKNIIEHKRVDYSPVEPKIIDFEYSRKNSFESNNRQQIITVLKDLGCYQIPRSIKSLKQFTKNLDYLGCKLVEVSDDLRFLYLFLVKLFDEEGTVLVDESKLELKSYSNNKDSEDIKQITQDLLQIRNKMHEDVINGTVIRQFFQKYLQVDLRSERGFGSKNLMFFSGTTQYKVVIEPILLCNNPPKSMEKSLVFPYQRNTNLHAVTRSDLTPLVKFLEKKYKMIEKRTKKTSTIKDYHKSEISLSSSVRYASIPIFGYSVALLVIYFAKIYFLLRLFNTIGLALLGVYLSLLAFFYFRAYKTKKEFTVQFETPYYQQALEFSETDLLDFQEELTDELMTQFGYECLGKEASFGVIEQVEAKFLKSSIETKRSEPKLRVMFEADQPKAETATPSPTKYGGKYSSFLEDP